MQTLNPLSFTSDIELCCFLNLYSTVFFDTETAGNMSKQAQGNSIFPCLEKKGTIDNIPPSVRPFLLFALLPSLLYLAEAAASEYECTYVVM